MAVLVVEAPTAIADHTVNGLSRFTTSPIGCSKSCDDATASSGACFSEVLMVSRSGGGMQSDDNRVDDNISVELEKQCRAIRLAMDVFICMSDKQFEGEQKAI